MILSKFGREYYKVQITTTPALATTAWSATFDGGTTWVNAIDVGGSSAWLVAGSSAVQGTAVAVISRSVTPVVRATDNPEILAKNAPSITLT